MDYQQNYIEILIAVKREVMVRERIKVFPGTGPQNESLPISIDISDSTM